MKIGDIFYTHETTSTENEPNKYNIYKVLVHDKKFGVLHVLAYEPTKNKPTKDDIPALSIFAYHLPISENSFSNVVLIDNRPVQDDELIGYQYYMNGG